MRVHGERRSKRYRGSDRKVEISGSREPNVPAIRPPIKLRGASNLQESMRRARQLVRSGELRCLNLRPARRTSKLFLRKEEKVFRSETSSGPAAWIQASRTSHRQHAEGQLCWAQHNQGRGRRGREIVPTVRSESSRRRRKPTRGAGCTGPSPALRKHRTLRGEQSPEVGGRSCWRGSNRRRFRRNGKRA